MVKHKRIPASKQDTWFLALKILKDKQCDKFAELFGCFHTLHSYLLNSYCIKARHRCTCRSMVKAVLFHSILTPLQAEGLCSLFSHQIHKLCKMSSQIFAFVYIFCHTEMLKWIRVYSVNPSIAPPSYVHNLCIKSKHRGLNFELNIPPYVICMLCMLLLC